MIVDERYVPASEAQKARARELLEIRRRYDAEHAERDADIQQQEEGCGEHSDRQFEVLTEIMQTRPKTIAGLKAKCDVLRQWQSSEAPEIFDDIDQLASA
jgi:hypothetical protein